MREPTLRTSRLAIAGALVAAALIAGAGFYLGRSTSTEGASERRSDPTLTPAPVPAGAAIVSDSFLDRADVIELATAAADAEVSGMALPDKVRDAVGRRVEFALPFGCSGPATVESEAPLRWRYDEGDQALRLHVAVTRWQASDWGWDQPADADGDSNQVIEGFWIARPWSSRGECPARPTSSVLSATSAIPEPSLAIAQFLRDDGRREALREGRPYESVERIPRIDFEASRGFRLLLSGRIGRVPDVGKGVGGPIRCIQPGGDIESRPRCIVAVTLDEVRIENPTNDAVLASWPIGRD